MPPFMQAFFSGGDLPPIPPAPPSPPMPPKRRISVPLEPPQFTRKPFLDPHPKGKGVPPPEVHVPRYTDLKKKPEFFLGLGTATLKCLSVGVIQSDHAGLQKLFQDKLRPELISQLAWLILNIGSITASSSPSSSSTASATATTGVREKREGKKAKATSGLRDELAAVGAELMEMVHEMILNDSSHHMLHGVLLHELGLSIKCWSLQIPSASLSVLGRVLVCRLQRQGQVGVATTGDDQLTVNIWKGYACFLMCMCMYMYMYMCMCIHVVANGCFIHVRVRMYMYM